MLGHTCQRAGPPVGLNGPGRAEVFIFVNGPQRALLLLTNQCYVSVRTTACSVLNDMTTTFTAETFAYNRWGNWNGFHGF